MSPCVLFGIGAVCALLAIVLFVIGNLLAAWRFKTIAILRTLSLAMGLLAVGAWLGAIVRGMLNRLNGPL